MPAPFLRLLLTTSSGPKSLKVIIAASGPALFCFNSEDGTVLSTWPHGSPSAIPETTEEKDDDDTEPPAKRQRTSEAEEDVSDAASAKVLIENGSTERPQRRKKKPQPRPSVIKLCASSDGSHVVAVTGEDKTLRVLELLDGQLKQISERQMPKKPSSITLSPDQKSILAADKFGDVYSLPLVIEEGAEAPQKTPQPEQKPYKPAATNLTVHTKKNLQALQHQLKSKNSGEKKTYDFEHTLLLGHVSLLTDLLAVVHNVNGHNRNYILTADRDEHIRVSRGVPQTHVIETFCLGHTSFINKLLIPKTQPDVLLSGGGDDFIMTWDWVKGQETGRASLLEHVSSIRMSLLSIADDAKKPDEDSSENKIAVSGMWSVPWRASDDGSSTDVLVACEAVPALLVFRLDAAGLHHHENIALEGNPLDVVCDETSKAILVSVDNVHRPGSITEVHKSSSRPLVQTFSHSATENSWQAGGKLIGLEHLMNDWANDYSGDEADVEDAALGDLLYGIEHFRKTLGTGAEEEG